MTEIEAVSLELRQLGYKYLRATEKADAAQKRIASIEGRGIEYRRDNISAAATAQIYGDIYEPYRIYQEIIVRIRGEGCTQQQVSAFWSAIRAASTLGPEAQEKLLLRPGK